jgi:hypothetical protein
VATQTQQYTLLHSLGSKASSVLTSIVRNSFTAFTGMRLDMMSLEVYFLAFQVVYMFSSFCFIILTCSFIKESVGSLLFGNDSLSKFLFNWLRRIEFL